MSEISSLDKGIIRNMMLKNSHKEIADVIGLDKTIVASVIAEMIEGTAIITKQMLLDQKKISQPKKVAKPKPISDDKIKDEWHQQKEQKIRNTNEADFIQRKRHAETLIQNRSYKTRELDLTKHQSVKIDDKTTILISISEDANEAKKKFYNNRKQQKKEEEIY